MSLRSLLLGLWFTICSTQLFGLNVIFDLNGVLVRTKSSNLWGHIDYKLFAYYVAMGNPWNVRQELLSFLRELKPDQDNSKPTDDNKPLPQLMADWQSGVMKGPEVLSYIQNALSQSQTLDSKQAARQVFLHHLCSLVFSSETGILVHEWDQAMLELVKLCKNNGHKLYILTNWSSDGFELFKKQHKAVFDLFDGIVVSGDAGVFKPHPDIYKKLLTQYCLKPEESIFIDDQEVNIVAAQKLGIKGIVCPQVSGWFSGKSADVDTVKPALLSYLRN
jgi:FMN phosphatase YigB (HAD superfamily)